MDIACVLLLNTEFQALNQQYKLSGDYEMCSNNKKEHHMKVLHAEQCALTLLAAFGLSHPNYTHARTLVNSTTLEKSIFFFFSLLFFQQVLFLLVSTRTAGVSFGIWPPDGAIFQAVR